MSTQAMGSGRRAHWGNTGSNSSKKAKRKLGQSAFNLEALDGRVFAGTVLAAATEGVVNTTSVQEVLDHLGATPAGSPTASATDTTGSSSSAESATTWGLQSPSSLDQSLSGGSLPSGDASGSDAATADGQAQTSSNDSLMDSPVMADPTVGLEDATGPTDDPAAWDASVPLPDGSQATVELTADATLSDSSGGSTASTMDATGELQAIADSGAAMDLGELDGGGGTFYTMSSNPPAAPTNLVATATGYSPYITLTWSNPVGSDATAIYIERATDPTFTYDVQTPVQVSASATTYTTPTLINGETYYFRVRAFNGLYSSYSNTASARSITPAPRPSAPTDLSSTAVSATQMNITWTDVPGSSGSPTEESSYRIERATNSSFTQGIFRATAARDATSYSDTTRQVGTIYYYRVQAFSSWSGTTYGYSDLSSVLAPPAVMTAASASVQSNGRVINLSVLGGSSAGESTLRYTWTTITKPTGVADPVIPAGGTNAAKNTAATVSALGTYRFRVTITDANNHSVMSEVQVTANPVVTSVSLSPATATVDVGKPVFLAPTARDQFNNEMATQPAYSWQILYGGAGTINSGIYTAPASGSGQVTVRATAGGVYADATVTFDTPAIPYAPTDLTAMANSGSEIEISWRDQSSNETGWTIEYSTRWNFSSNVTALSHGAGGGTAVARKVTGLAAGTTYYFRVRANNANGSSSYGNTAVATTLSATMSSTNPTDDAMVQGTGAGGSYGDTNFGSSSPMYVKTVPTDASYTRQTYLKFDISSFTTIGSARLRLSAWLNTPLSPSVAVDVRPVSNLTWTEGTITYNNRPAADPTPLATFTVSGCYRSWYEVDLTSYVRQRKLAGDTSISLALIAPVQKDSLVAIDSGESSTSWPKLMIDLAPNAPANVTATAASGCEIDLTWTDTSGDEDGFRIEYSTQPDFSSNVQTALAPMNATNRRIAGLDFDTRYYFRVRAYKSGVGDSAYASADALTRETNAYDGTPVNLPGNIEAERYDLGGEGVGYHDSEASNQGGQFRPGDGVDIYTLGSGYGVGWTASGEWMAYSVNVPATGIYSFSVRAGCALDGRQVHLEVDGVDVTGPLDMVNTGSWSTYQVTQLASLRLGKGLHVLKLVMDTNSAGSFDYLSFALTHASPVEPNSVFATALGGGQVKVTWDPDLTLNELGFKIERSEDLVTWKQVGQVAADSASFLDSGLTAGKLYWYRVAAYDAVVQSEWVGPSPATTAALAAPSDAEIDFVSSTQVNLSWQDNSDGEKGFKIERSANGGAFTVIGTVGAGVTSYSDTTASEATYYTYHIYAYSDDGVSNYCTATTTTLPAAAGGVVAVPSAGGVNVLWTNRSGGATGYKVERSSDGGATWTEVANLNGAGTSSYLDTDATGIGVYSYRILTKGLGGDAAPSLIASSNAVLIDLPNNVGANGWTVVTSSTGTGAGSVAAGDEYLELVEGQSLLTSIEYSFQIPQGPSILALRYSDLLFADDNNETSVRDAFEIAVVDAEGRPLAGAFAPGRDAAFNISEHSTIPALGERTHVEGETIRISLEGLAPQQAKLIIRLVNNDSYVNAEQQVKDASSRVRIHVGTTNWPPVLGVIDDQTINEGDSVTFTAGFGDPDGTASTSYSAEVNWGDGTDPTPATTTLSAGGGTGTISADHVYADNGTYVVTVTLRDNDPNSIAGAPRQFTVEVLNIAPTANFTNTGPVGKGATAELRFDGASDPSPQDRAAGFTYSFDFNNDGIFELTGNTPVATVPGSYLPGVGAYVMRGRITDKDHAFRDYTTTVTVQNQLPQLAQIPALSGQEGQSVSLSVGLTDGDVADTHDWTINWGDGTSSSGHIADTNGSATISASHIYADNGTYNVTVHVTDSDGGIAERATQATITNVAPNLTAGYGYRSVDTTGGKQLEFVISGRFTDPGFTPASAVTQELFGEPGHLGTVAINWDVDGLNSTDEYVDASIANGREGVLTSGTFVASHRYSSYGKYKVQITVRDDDGDTGTAQFSYHYLWIDVIESINLNSNGNVQVDIETDASTLSKIDPLSLRFGPSGAPEKDQQLQNERAQFYNYATGIQPADDAAFLTGIIRDGSTETPFVGMGTIDFATNTERGIPGSMNGTKFFVVDAGTNPEYTTTYHTVFGYGQYTTNTPPEPASGSPTSNALFLPFKSDDGALLSHPIGIASNQWSDRLWTIDANTGQIIVLNANGDQEGTLETWGISRPQGITTSEVSRTETAPGTPHDLWVVDAPPLDGNGQPIGLGRVVLFSGAASQTLGRVAGVPIFELDAANLHPSDLVTDGTYFYVTDSGANDADADRVFVYSATGHLEGYWLLQTTGTSGITLDAGTVGDTNIYTVDRATKAVYRYSGARSPGYWDGQLHTVGTADIFALADYNDAPEGIADPPTSAGTDFWTAFPWDRTDVGESRAISITTDATGMVTGHVVTPGGWSADFALNKTNPTGAFESATASVTVTIPIGTGTGEWDTRIQIVDGVESSKAIHIYVDDGQPAVSVYAGTLASTGRPDRDGWLVLPTAVLGTDYRVMNYPITHDYGSEFVVVATEPGTTRIWITPSVTAREHAAGVAYYQDLTQGQVYQMRADYRSLGLPLDGTVVTAEQPVALISANHTANPDGGAPGFMGEQLLPTNLWGKRFLVDAANMHGHLRVMAQTDTLLWVDVSEDPLNPTFSLPAGQVYDIPIDPADPYEIRASAPVQVALYNEEVAPAGSGPYETVSMMLVPAMDQFVDHYTLNVPSLTAGDTFVNLIVPATQRDGQVTVTMGGTQTILSASDFHSVDLASQWYAARVLVTSTGPLVLTAGGVPFGAWLYSYERGYSYLPDASGYVAGLRFPPGALAHQLALDPGNATQALGLEHVARATVRDANNQPLEGVEVLFTVTDPDHPDPEDPQYTVFASGTGITGPDGIAYFHYTSSSERYDEITAAPVGSSLRATAHVRWIDSNAPVINVTWPQEDASFPAGQTIVLEGTATPGSDGMAVIGVTIDGQPVESWIPGAPEFYSPVTLKEGVNRLVLQAIDAANHRTTLILTLNGLAADTPKVNSVSGSSWAIEGRHGRTSFDERSDTLYSDLAIYNRAEQDLLMPLWIGIDYISDPRVQVLTPDGVTPDGIPYFNFSNWVAGGTLAGQALSGYRTIAFSNPEHSTFTYRLVLLDQSNAAPLFSTAPILQAVAGRPYVYDADAWDGDGDAALTFSIPSSDPNDPSDPQIDAVTGEVTWVPADGDVGSRSIIVRVTDSNGAWTEQTYTLRIGSMPPNRAPRFSSVPVVLGSTGEPYSYEVRGYDPDGDVITFSFGPGDGPEGMTFDATNRLLTWTPTAAGRYEVTLHLSDGAFATDQGFMIYVAPHAPVIVTQPAPTSSYVGQTFRYDMYAVDADGDGLTYRLVKGPADMTVTNVDEGGRTIGRVSWPASLLNSDSRSEDRTVTLSVRDATGYTTTQTFVLTVLRSSTIILPASIGGFVFEDTDGDSIRETTETSVLSGWTIYLDQNQNRKLDLNERSTVSAADGSYLFDQLAPGRYVLAAIPAAGQALTAPVQGEVAVTVEAAQELTGVNFGGHAVVTENHAPVFRTLPPLTAVVGKPYVYRAFATDRDGDTLTYSLTAPPGTALPDGLILDPSDPHSGTISWQPNAAQIGLHTITLWVDDLRGGTGTQTFTITVTAGDGDLPPALNAPPFIQSRPPISAAVGQVWSYPIRAIDPDNDNLTFTLEAGPTNMRFVGHEPQDLSVSWTDTDRQPPILMWIPTDNVPRTVRIRVSDGYHSQTQEFTIQVSGQPADRFPVITSYPQMLRAKTDLPSKPWSYTIEAHDPDGDPVTLSLSAESLAKGVHFREGSTNIIDWAPTGAQAGPATVTVYARSGNKEAVQTFVVKAEPNALPQFGTMDLQTATAGARFVYKVPVTDDNGDPIALTLTSPVEGMSIDNYGQLIWDKPAGTDIGTTRTVSLTATDGYGDPVTATVDITVVADTQPPKVQLHIWGANVLPVGLPDPEEPRTFAMSVDCWVADNVEVDYLLIESGDPGAPLAQQTRQIDAASANLKLYFDVPYGPGVFRVRVTAVDVNGNHSEAASVDFTQMLQRNKPVAELSPFNEPTGSITGTASDDDTTEDLSDQTWSLELRPAAGGSTIKLVSNATSRIINDELARLDTTSLPNGHYTLTLLVWDRANRVAKDEMDIEITGQAKVGNFRFSEVDVQIPLAGIPLTLTRSYDTLNKDRQSPDFGYGWTLGLDMGFEEGQQTRQSFPLEYLENTFGTTADFGRTVSIRTGGSRDVFLTLPDGRRVRFTFDVDWQAGRAYFRAESGVTAKLEIDGSDSVEPVAAEEVGYDDYYWTEDGGPTTGEIVFFNPAAPYLLQDKHDIPGYILTLEDGTKYYFRKQESDETANAGGQGLMVDISNEPTDGINGQIKHIYSGKPKLWKIVDASGNEVRVDETGFHYRNADNSGDLRSLNIGRDGAGRITSVSDDNQLLVEYRYGPQGDLEQVIRHVSDTQTITTTYEYLKSGGFSTHQLMAVLAPSGKRPIINEYDPQTGRLTATVDSFGKRIEYTHSVDDPQAEGRWEQVEDRRGGITLYDYDDYGNVTFVQTPSGQKTAYQYYDPTRGEQPEHAAAGLVKKEIQYLDPSDLTNPAKQFVKTYTYEGSYRTSESYSIDGATIRTTWRYIDVGPVGQQLHLLEATINPDGTISYNQYDNTTRLLVGTRQIKATTADLSDPVAWQAYVDDPANWFGRTVYSDFFRGQAKRVTRYVAGGDGQWNQAYVVSVSAYQEATNGFLTESRTEAPDGTVLQKTTYDVDGRGNVTATHQWNRNESGTWVIESTTSREYDRLGRVTWTHSPRHDGQVGTLDTETKYNDDGQVEQSIDARGRITHYRYNAMGQSSVVTSGYGTADATSTSTTYDEDGKVATSTDQFNNVTRSYYDSAGRSVQTVYPDGTSTETVYDEAGRPYLTTDRHVIGQAGNASRTIYDPAGRSTGSERLSGVCVEVTLGTHPTSGATIAQTTLAQPGTVVSSTTTHYDAIGRVDWSIDASGGRTDYVYDPLTGRQSQVLQPEVTDGTTGLRIRPTSTSKYDDLGRQIEVTDYYGRTTKFVYDRLGRVRETIYPDATPATDTDNPRSKTEYDDLGRKIWSEDPEQVRTSTIEDRTDYEYNTSGDLTAVKQPQVNDPENGDALVRPRTEYEYDQHGQLTVQRDAKGRVTLYSYDPLTGRRTIRTLPAIGETTVSESTVYDPRYGRVKTQTDFKLQVTEFLYDDDSRLPLEDQKNLGRLVEKRLYVNEAAYASGTYTRATHYHYDVLGRTDQITVRKGDGTIKRTESYTYDIDGRLITSVQPEGTLHYEYHPTTGQQTRVWTGTDPNAPVTDTLYDYDELGRLKTVTSVRQRGQVVPLDQQTTTYTYDALGNRYSVTLPNGITTTYTYNERSFLDLEEIRNAGGTLLDSYDYTVNDAGQRTDVAENHGGTLRFVHYDYDSLKRLKAELITDPVKGNQTIGYRYDLVGNRRMKTVDEGSNGSIDQTINYTYNERDQLTQEVSDTAGTTTYLYDANGSTTRKTRVLDSATVEDVIYRWSLRNHLIGIDTNADETDEITYRYNTDGIRISASENGQTTLYLVDGQNLSGYAKPIEEKSAPEALPTRSYVLADEIIAQADASSGLLYLLKDGHGTTRALANAVGSVTARYDLDAFGNAIGFDMANAATSRFLPDGITDADSGLTYQNARYSFRQNGNWWSEDEDGHGRQEDPLSLHKYLYGNGDPVNQWDPSGRYSIDFHFYVIYYLMRARGWERAVAQPVAGYSQYVDDDPATTPYALGGWGVAGIEKSRDLLRDFHFPGSSSSTLTRRDDEGVRTRLRSVLERFRWLGDGKPKSGDMILAGRWLHTYADSWGHEGFTAYPGSGHADLTQPDLGHGTDDTSRDVGKALDAAVHIYNLLPSRQGGHVLGLKAVKEDLRDAFTNPRLPALGLTDSQRVDNMLFVLNRRFGELPRYDKTDFAANRDEYLRELGLAKLQPWHPTYVPIGQDYQYYHTGVRGIAY